MKRIRIFFLGGIIALLFIGNVGVDVYKHICREDGISVSYLINTIDHCDDKHEHERPCCSEDDDDCCDDEVNYFQIKLDFFENVSSNPVFVPATQPICITNIKHDITQNRKWINVDYTDPPPLSNQERRSILQVYTI